VSLLFVGLLLLSGVQYVLWILPEKPYFYLIYLGICHVLFSDKVLGDFSQSYQKASYYFQSLNSSKLMKYYAIRWYIAYELVSLCILFPTSGENLFFACLTFALFNLLFLLELLEKRYLSQETYARWNASQNVALCAVLFLYGRWRSSESSVGWIQALYSLKESPAWTFLLAFICVALFWANYRVLLYRLKGENRNECVAVSTFTFFLPKSKELLYIMRKRTWVDALFVGLVGNFISYSIASDSVIQQVETAICAWASMFVVIYLEVMIAEDGRLLAFYRKKDGLRMRIDKIKAVLQISIILLIIIGILQAVLLSMTWWQIVLAYLLAGIVFVLSALVCKTGFEKTGNWQQVLTTGGIVKQLFFIIVGLVVIIGIAEYGLKINR
jgi:hypothetical protein